VLNADRIAKGSADLLSARTDMENILAVGKEAFLSEKNNPLALKYLLIESVEAITDICQHILAKIKGEVCGGYVDCIVKAGNHGIIQPELSNKLRKLADLRNSLIHRYWIINDEELFNQCRANINDFTDFATQITAFLDAHRS